MSERSFALWSVGLALVFGAVVPEPGKAPEPLGGSGMAVVEPAPAPVSETPQQAVLRPLEGLPLAVNHAVGRKSPAEPSAMWAVHNPR